MGYKGAEAAQLYTLHDITATWLSDHVPLYVPQNELRNGRMQIYNDLPAVKTEVADYGIQFPGGLVEDIEPRAARDLHISSHDVVEATFTPAQYNITDDQPPQLWLPATLYTVRDTTGRRGDIDFQFSLLSNGAHYVAWNGRESLGVEISLAECASLTLIAQRLGDFHQSMVANGIYPEDVLQHRHEREIAETADHLTAQLERETLYAACQRLHELPTHDQVDPWALHELQRTPTSNDKTYAQVSRSDIGTLYEAITHRMLTCNTALHLFPDTVAAQATAVVHEPGIASQTNVEYLTLKAEHSNVGLVVSFIIGKTVVFRDGVQRAETDTAMFHNDRYIRFLQFEEATRGRVASSRIDARRPLTRTHIQAFHQLLSWLKPAHE